MLRNFTGSTGIRAAIAVLMLLFVVACSGSDSGIKRQRDEARAAQAAAEKAAAEAEAARKAAVEKAAAEAEAARKAAEKAAAEEREKVLAEQEVMDVNDAVAAANALIATLTNDSDDEAIMAARDAVNTATTEIQGATRLTQEQTDMYTSQVTMAGLRLDATEANIMAARNLARAQDAEGEMQAVTDAKSAVATAITDLGAAQTAKAASMSALETARMKLDTAGAALGTTDDAEAEIEAFRMAQQALTAAQQDYATKTEELEMAESALEEANKTLAEVAPDASALAAAQAALTAARNAAKEAAKSAEMAAGQQADKIKELEEKVADLEKAEEGRKAAEKMLAATTKAKKVNTAIRANSGTAPTYSVEATVDAMTAKVSTPTGYEDTGAAPEADSLPTGWRGRTLTKGDSMLVVYSDIASATPTALGNLYNGTVVNNVRAYNVDETAADSADNEIQLSDIKRDNNAVSTEDKGASGDSAEDVHSFTGRVRGVAGTFSCTGLTATCTALARTSNGSLAAGNLEGTWTFTPTNANAMVNVQDKGYLSLGWWLSKNTDGSYSFNRIAGMGYGNLAADYSTGDNSAQATAAGIEGKATYKGAAAGKYSFVDTVENEADGGHWTATATLTANFDVDNTPADDTDDVEGVSLSGELTNFMGGTDTRDVSDWKVTLKQLADTDTNVDGVQAATDFTAQTGAPTEWSLGEGAANGTGTWAYTFRGDAGPTDNVAQPGAVTGEFDASVGQRAHITGAFGATKEVPAN